MIMDKSTYLTSVGQAFDLGLSDGQSQAPKKDYTGAYAAGYDGYYLPTSVRQITVDAASKGWDDGAAGAAKGTPEVPVDFTAGNLIADLKQTYDFAYDLGAANPASGSKSSYLGWVAAAAAAVVIGAGVLYTMKKKQLAGTPKLAAANPSKRKAVFMQNVEAVETVDGEWIILVSGFQWGPPGSPRDRSGAASNTWPTKKAAIKAFKDSERGET